MTHEKSVLDDKQKILLKKCAQFLEENNLSEYVIFIKTDSENIMSTAQCTVGFFEECFAKMIKNYQDKGLRSEVN